MSNARSSAALLAALLAAPAPAGAEIYRWTDESGTIHFTEDLSEVPAAQRDAARAVSRDDAPGASRIQTYQPRAGAVLSHAPSPSPPAARAPGPRVHRIRVAPTGNVIRVAVRLNDRVTAPFIVDTGATDVTIPEHVAARLGIEIGPDTHKSVYGTANGWIETPVILLDSVDLGGARVENVRASISPVLDVGLLGMSYFSRFRHQIDAAAGLITLIPNETPGRAAALRGGRTEQQWRHAFRSLRARIETVERRVETISPRGANNRRRIAEARERARRELEFLEEQADRARVPDAWRY